MERSPNRLNVYALAAALLLGCAFTMGMAVLFDAANRPVQPAVQAREGTSNRGAPIQVAIVPGRVDVVAVRARQVELGKLPNHATGVPGEPRRADVASTGRTFVFNTSVRRDP